MVELYIKSDDNILKYVVTVQKYNKEKSIGDIRNAILNGTPVITRNLNESDTYSSLTKHLEPHDLNLLFLDLVNQLIDMGAEVTIKEDDAPITVDELSQRIAFAKEIYDQVQDEIDLEIAEEDENIVV